MKLGQALDGEEGVPMHVVFRFKKIQTAISHF